MPTDNAHSPVHSLSTQLKQTQISRPNPWLEQEGTLESTTRRAGQAQSRLQAWGSAEILSSWGKSSLHIPLFRLWNSQSKRAYLYIAFRSDAEM